MRVVGSAHRSGQAGRWAADGFLGPLPLLSAGECALLLSHRTFGAPIAPDTWPKGLAVTDRVAFDVASSPRLLALLHPILGPDIILWGARFVRRRPGHAHAWHVDLETTAPDRRFASVWIGLEHTSRASGLAFVGGSHLYPKTLAELEAAEGRDGAPAADDTLLAWARAFDPQAEITQPDITDGEALIFDGRLWHGTLNRRATGTRITLLLHYAEAGAAVFMQDLARRERPLLLVAEPRPPVILLAGAGNGGGNRQVAPPAAAAADAVPLVAEVRAVVLPLARDAQAGWRRHPLFRGATAAMAELACHVTVVEPGRIPHPPHAHLEEEILIVLDGRAELLTGDGAAVETAQIDAAGPGTCAYFPAYRHHAVRNAGAGPLTCLTFKWRGPPLAVGAPLAAAIVDPADRPARAGMARLLLEGPTNFLGSLQVRALDIAAGGGGGAQDDRFDVAIVVLAGTIETTGRIVGPCGVAFHRAGEPRRFRVVGGGPARCLAIAFHGETARASGPLGKAGKAQSLIAPLKRRLIAAARCARRAIVPD